MSPAPARPPLQVLDHHKTAAAELTDPALVHSCPSLEVVFDMARSGATIRCCLTAGLGTRWGCRTRFLVWCGRWVGAPTHV